HACIVDGVRLHLGKRFTYKHNDVESLEKNLQRATKVAEQTGGGILVISEGVFGMRGEQGRLKEIAALKSKYNFRFLVDDAHGFGTLGENGKGAGNEQGIQDQIDVYFATFAKSMASTGAFVAADQEIIDYLKYNMRSQMFAKSLQMQLVKGALKDLRENYGIFCSIVVYPVIPKGLILLRLIPTATHTLEDVQITLDAFAGIREKLENGTYKRLSEAVKAV
ncbi:MAG: aminotransferase class I/II-fold pyridoxal phosphate-dependent enzyme, partial [Flavobacteriia bacterium]|nr:aminotransferase class I/II-fold pyridoxal phosphate-dependent enzyme [Flavobacteriia bacterium]